MPATRNNPDYLQDHRHFRVESEEFDVSFVFRRLSLFDREKIDDLVWTYCKGHPEKMSGLSQLLYTSAATLQTALVSPTPRSADRPDGFSFADEEDAEGSIIDLHDKYVQWRNRFRRPAADGAGGSGGAAQPERGVGLPENLEPATE